MSKQEKIFNVRFDPEVHKELKQVSEDTNISMNWLIEKSVKELLRQYKGEGIAIKEG